MMLFPRDKSKNKNYNIDGPQPPDLDKYPKKERVVVWDAYKKKRKAFTDQQRKNRANLACEGLKVSEDVNPSDYKGCNLDRIRTMDKVEAHPLMANHTFSSRDIVYLRVAEEANLRSIVIKINRSDNQQFVASGIDFYVRALFTDGVGWLVTTAVCRDGDDILKIPPSHCVTIPLELQSGRSIGTPLKSKMLVPIILNAVAGNPGIPSRYLRELFSKYVRSYALTDSILQEAKDLAKKQIFGQAKHNV
jgi:hypothetical protein